MDILKTRSILALGISGVMSVGTATAKIPEADTTADTPIIAVSSPDLRVTVYDGIATLFGNAASSEEARLAEEEICSVEGIDHVINMITWE